MEKRNEIHGALKLDCVFERSESLCDPFPSVNSNQFDPCDFKEKVIILPSFLSRLLFINESRRPFAWWLEKNSRFLLFFVSRRPYFFIFTKMWPLIRSLDFHLREQTTFCLYNFFFKKKIVPRISSFDFHFRGRTTFCDIILLLKKRYYQKFSIADDLLASHLKKRPLIFFCRRPFWPRTFDRGDTRIWFFLHIFFFCLLFFIFFGNEKKTQGAARGPPLFVAGLRQMFDVDSGRLHRPFGGCMAHRRRLLKKKRTKNDEKMTKAMSPTRWNYDVWSSYLNIEKKIIEFDKMFLFQVLSFHKETRFNFLLLCTSES